MNTTTNTTVVDGYTPTPKGINIHFEGAKPSDFLPTSLLMHVLCVPGTTDVDRSVHCVNANGTLGTATLVMTYEEYMQNVFEEEAVAVLGLIVNELKL